MQGGSGLGLGFSHQRRNLVYEKVVGQVILVARILGEGDSNNQAFFRAPYHNSGTFGSI